MSQKFTFSEKKERGLDFLRFLDTEKVDVNNKHNGELRELYNKNYRTYISQVNPTERLPHFSAVIQALIFTRIGYLSQDRFFLTPPGMGATKLGRGGQFSRPGSASFANGRQGPRYNSNPQVPLQGNPNLPYAGMNNPNQGYASAANQNQGYDPAANPNVGYVQAANQNQGFVPEQNQNRAAPNQSYQNFKNYPAPPDRKVSPRRHQYRKNKIAVDQHISFNKPVENTEGARDEARGQRNHKFDWTYVYQSGHLCVCKVCNATCTSQKEMERHLEGRRHRLAVVMSELRNKKDSLVSDKNGITISVAALPVKDGTYMLDIEEGVPASIAMTIMNHNVNRTVELVHCEMLKRVRVFQLDDTNKVTEAQGTSLIHPGGVYDISIKAEARHVGSFHAPIAFQFRLLPEGQEQSVWCHILRFVHAKCKNPVIEQLRPTSKFKRPPRVAHKQEALEVVPGMKLPFSKGDSLEKEIELDTFRIPNTTRKIINRGLKDTKGLNQAEKVELNSLKNILDDPLNMTSYIRRFSSLLHFEEIQMEVDIRKYDMEGVSMTVCPNNKRLLQLKVPGLAENRPSVLKGDWLYVRISADGSLSQKEYQGFVHEVQRDEVALGFDKSLLDKFVLNMKFNVRFVFNRLPLRLQHRACTLAPEESLDSILFPVNAKVLRNTATINTEIKMHDPKIDKNNEQKCAVQHILTGTSRPAPYLVFGPPGTGKTMTIVEAMKQVYKHIPKSHILACAPSNSAADLIAERLLPHVPKSKILRLNAMSRPWITVPDKIKDLCNNDKVTKQYVFPSKTDMCQYKVIICTLITAGRLASANFPQGHFTHVFIDEAGHAVEPEALIAIAGILDCSSAVSAGGQVVLAGDPKQLGPILRSPFAIMYGLDKSLLERYMDDCDIYQADRTHPDQESHYNPRIITKLLRNYRSHHAILEIPNKLFYESELEEFADPIDREKFCQWEGLPRKGFPLIFHSVIGEDMREERSPSFFNPEEAGLVLTYVQRLLAMRGRGGRVEQKDIGIISPYRKQVQKIQLLLGQKNFDKIQVGSVEEFQGQERTVIIVSTVRSNPEYLSLDMQFKLGFLKNPKRFNVTLTRAKALLVVIGNPNTLCQDEHWRTFIEYCRNKGAYIGTQMDTEDDQVEDILQRLVAVDLVASDEDGVTVPEIFSNFNEQQWRAEV